MAMLNLTACSLVQKCILKILNFMKFLRALIKIASNDDACHVKCQLSTKTKHCLTNLSSLSVVRVMQEFAKRVIDLICKTASKWVFTRPRYNRERSFRSCLTLAVLNGCVRGHKMFIFWGCLATRFVFWPHSNLVNRWSDCVNGKERCMLGLLQRMLTMHVEFWKAAIVQTSLGSDCTHVPCWQTNCNNLVLIKIAVVVNKHRPHRGGGEIELAS